MRTPGIWKYRHKPGEGHRVMTDFHGDGSLFCVTEVNPWQDCQANARLIAAAPDLYEACVALLRFNEELCADIGVSKHYPSAEKARRAIAKADERSPIGEPVP